MNKTQASYDKMHAGSIMELLALAVHDRDEDQVTACLDYMIANGFMTLSQAINVKEAMDF